MAKEFQIKSIEWDGKQITKPGIYSKIPLDVYHGADICDGPSVSSSSLRKAFGESLAHFYAEWPGNPDHDEPDEEKAHFILGRAVHHLILGEPFFAKLFAVQPDEYIDDKTGEAKKWTYGAKVCVAWRNARHKEGRSILKGEDVKNIRGMAERLSHNAIIRAGALNGMIERSLFWKDKDTGLWLKSRPDAIPTHSGDYTDLKTTTSVMWYDLRKVIYDNGYFQQMALIRTAARALGLPFNSATLIFIEKKKPWCERVVTLKDNVLDKGERANRWALDGIARCLKSGRWPGPGGERDDAAYIELPEWAEKSIDDKLNFEVDA